MSDHSSHPPSLPTESVWQKAPLVQFDAWLSSQDFATSSAEIYQLQWRQFVNWLEHERIALNAVEPDTVERFLINLEIKQDQRQRYLRLIERVFNYLRRDTFGTVNPATAVALNPELEWASVPPNDPTGFLDPSAYSTLASFLAMEPAPHLSTVRYWRAHRDRAIVAAFAGAGLKMAELQGLTVSCKFEGDDWLTFSDGAAQEPRRARLQPFALPILRAWLTIRADGETAGTLVFPATRAGRPMHKATVLRATHDLLGEAGVHDASGGRISPQTLRNSYAARWFESDMDIETVAQTLGFKQVVSAQRLKAAWEAWNQRASRTA